MEEKRHFPIFNSHLDLAHAWWSLLAHGGAQEGDWAIDATCGGGHDTLSLSTLFSGVIGLDIQAEAIEATRALLSSRQAKAELFCQSHASFPDLCYEKPIRLIVYNLGYFPGGDKSITTTSDSTLRSLEKALDLILPGGMVSITCYPGHAAGKQEEDALFDSLSRLPPKDWSVTFHRWNNRKNAPSILLIQKNTFF